MLRIRTALRSTVWRGFQEIKNAPVSYRMKGPKGKVELPLPTATDKDGTRLSQ